MNVARGAALADIEIEWVFEAEVGDDVGDDVGDGAVGDVFLEIRGVEAFAELGAEAFDVAGFAFGLGAAADPVLDLADDLLAGFGSLPGRVVGDAGLGEVADEEDVAAHGAGDALILLGNVDHRGRGLAFGGGLGLEVGLAADALDDPFTDVEQAEQIGVQTRVFRDGAVLLVGEGSGGHGCIGTLSLIGVKEGLVEGWVCGGVEREVADVFVMTR